MNNKIDFITDLLKSPKINASQKERLFALATDEIKNIKGNTDKQVFIELETLKNQLKTIENKTSIIEEHIGILPNIEEKVEDEIPKKELPNYIHPKYLRDFLIEYNQDSILKYTCHEIDDMDRFRNILSQCKTEYYNYEVHLQKIHSNFKNLTYKYHNKILKNVTALISTYLGTFNIDGSWSENKITVKWTSPGLLKWSIENSGKVPNPSVDFQIEKYRFNTIELKNGNSIANFSDLVIYFKNLFHFKNGNTLKTKLEETIFMKFQGDKFNIKFDNEFSELIELFTYSESLIQAFVKIINQKYHKDNFSILDVKLYFNYDYDGLKEFKIVIINSKEFGKHFTDFRLGDDFTDLINRQINGLCDFYIKAYFEDQKSIGLVNIWNGKPLKFIPTNEEIEGVEFILKMY
ncbi:hypothetical protein HNQ02_000693 [Flavobacterium sp. 7E]|uniref:hypothetical protein n=1 Tax=Flavobacterium sp. 7E TaxID=2735898 RepID=UPI00156F6D14|nr:hypothetical protein [Flavobacterium sp. 7E]NRS87786.1 hypothetical protein [Flavobacterium sp. 7E]